MRLLGGWRPPLTEAVVIEVGIMAGSIEGDNVDPLTFRVKPRAGKETIRT